MNNEDLIKENEYANTVYKIRDRINDDIRRAEQGLITFQEVEMLLDPLYTLSIGFLTTYLLAIDYKEEDIIKLKNFDTMVQYIFNELYNNLYNYISFDSLMELIKKSYEFNLNKGKENE